MISSPYPISVTLDILDGLKQVRRQHLFETSADDSHVQTILDQCETLGLRSRHEEVLDLWLAHDHQSRAVGMALITEETLRGQTHTLVNLFVAMHERGKGIASALMACVLEQYPRLEGHYTADSIKLYERSGVLDYFRHALPQGNLGERLLKQRHEDLKSMRGHTDLMNPLMEGYGESGRAKRSQARQRRRR